MRGHSTRTHARRPRVVIYAVIEDEAPGGAVADLYAPGEEEGEEWSWRRVEGASLQALQPQITTWKVRYGLRFGDISTEVSKGVPPLGGPGNTPAPAEDPTSRH